MLWGGGEGMGVGVGLRVGVADLVGAGVAVSAGLTEGEKEGDGDWLLNELSLWVGERLNFWLNQKTPAARINRVKKVIINFLKLKFINHLFSVQTV